jgi:flagellar protein FlaG
VKKVNVGPVEMNNIISERSVDTGMPKQNQQRQAPSVGEETINIELLKEQVSDIQNQISSMNVRLTFSAYGENGENIAIVVADKETGEVIREIPSKEIQNLSMKMNELTGLILNGEA